MKKLIPLLPVLLVSAFSYAQKNKKTDSFTTLQQQLAGTWTLVSVDNIYPDSSRVHPYGTGPKGLLMFDAAGNYAIQIFKAERPKIASGDKNKGTPEEYEALVQGSNSHFGSYSVDESNKTITFRVKYASFPNWENTTQKRAYTYTGNELSYVVTQTTQGGASVIAEVVWRRL